MNKHTYPFTGWVLGGTFTPKQVEFVAHRRWYGNDWHEARHGKDYQFSDVFETKDQAVDSGYERIATMRSRLEKQQKSIDKKLANIVKHRS